VPIEESDLIVRPDPETFHVLPWARDVSRVICDVYTPPTHKKEMEPFEGDTRLLLKKICKQIPGVLKGLMDVENKRFSYHVAPELEFFVLDLNHCKIDNRGYFDPPTHKMREFLTNIMEATGEMGIQYEAYHSEVAPSQYEFDFRYGDALKIADATVTLKDIIKNYAEKYELKATFMPKPFFDMNGSGMHYHLNLSMYSRGKEGEEKVNLFYDSKKQDLSDIARYFIGGLLYHAPAVTAITNPICNSYKRLVPGWEAPTKIAWGRKNRSALIRVPYGNPKATRCEYRSPDPSCNPYLAFAVTLAAGLDGIKNRIAPSEPIEEDLYQNARGINELPGSLEKALICLEKNDIIKEAMGSHIFRNFMEEKQKECVDYHVQPSNIDFQMYLDV
jgi:glutamine synthetase